MVTVAVESGILPSQFWDLDKYDKNLLVAWHRTKGTIEAYEHHLNEKRMKAATRK